MEKEELLQEEELTRQELNKQEFLNLINSIEREFDKEKLVAWLEKSDFFTAPATTKYHCSYEGGLLEHSLNVYYCLKNLVETYFPIEKNEEGEIVKECPYSDDTLKIIGLLHDISKANYYEKYIKNVKEGNNWIKVEEYKVREDVFVYGNDEQKTEFMVSTFIPLEIEERVALLHKSGGKAFDSTDVNVPLIFNKYPLATLLHTADILATYIIER